uniref:Uncharacterized protein n=1 Tax=Anguilla anguilla TaxID=7936 RepID=A0A0E9Y138_ANGAN
MSCFVKRQLNNLCTCYAKCDIPNNVTRLMEK